MNIQVGFCSYIYTLISGMLGFTTTVGYLIISHLHNSISLQCFLRYHPLPKICNQLRQRITAINDKFKWVLKIAHSKDKLVLIYSCLQSKGFNFCRTQIELQWIVQQPVLSVLGWHNAMKFHLCLELVQLYA